MVIFTFKESLIYYPDKITYLMQLQLATLIMTAVIKKFLGIAMKLLRTF